MLGRHISLLECLDDFCSIRAKYSGSRHERSAVVSVCFRLAGAGRIAVGSVAPSISGAFAMPKSRSESAARHPVSIFFSYSSKDKELRDSLQTSLTSLEREGLVSGWHDRMIEPGKDWAREIDEQLESAQLILLLISRDFIASKYCYEIEMTRAMQKHRAGEARVIPVILRPSDWQNTPFGALNALPPSGRPVTSYPDLDEALLEVAKGIRAVVRQVLEGSGIPSQGAAQLAKRSDTLTGLSSASPVGDVLPKLIPEPIAGTKVVPILETGTVAIDSPFYQPRRSDERAMTQLESSNPTVVVKGSRQSGKSSLLARLANTASEQKQRSCYLNLQDLDSQSVRTTARLFPSLMRMMARELGLEEGLTPKADGRSKKRSSDPRQDLTDALEDVVLKADPTSFLLVFDEVDRVFDHKDCREELFSMIRSWHERRQRAAASSPWKRLRIAIAHATDPGLWIDDLTQSPFNVGLQLDLEDFEDRQVGELNKKHGAPLSGTAEVSRLMDLVGGRPYLVRVALYTLAVESWSLDRLDEVALDAGSPFSHHLDDYLAAVQKQAAMAKELRSILDRGVCSNEQNFQKLWSAGLINGKSPRSVTMRCRLYRDFFNTRL
jgi:hypothetical protein